MRTQLFKLVMVGVLITGLSACDEGGDVLGPDQSNVTTETGFAVDLDLSEGIIEDAEAELNAVGASVGSGPMAAPGVSGVPDPEKLEEARALLEEARQKYVLAREAWRLGDTELAAQLAEEARRLVAQALLLVFGEEAVERAMERIDHLISWLQERVDEQNSDFLNRIIELRDEAQARWDAGDLEGALERLLLARQIASRDRSDHRRDDIAQHARLSIFMAHSSINLALEIIGEPTERQAYAIRFAANLTEKAERAFSEGRFRLSFTLAREAVNLTLIAVIHDPDFSDLDKVELMARITAEAIAAAEEAVAGTDKEFAARLLEHAKNLEARAIELAPTAPRIAVHIFWHAATLANGVVFLVDQV